MKDERDFLYIRKIHLDIHEKIDMLVKKTQAKKWMVIEAILCEGLKIKNKNDLNIKKYLKKK